MAGAWLSGPLYETKMSQKAERCVREIYHMENAPGNSLDKPAPGRWVRAYNFQWQP